MKHSIAVKFVAFLIAAFSLVAAFGGGVGIVAMESAGLYVNGLDALQDREYKNISSTVAHDYVELYAVEQFGNLPYNLKRTMYADPDDRGDTDYWKVKLQQGEEVIVDPGAVTHYTIVKEYTISPNIPSSQPKVLTAMIRIRPALRRREIRPAPAHRNQSL